VPGLLTRLGSRYARAMYRPRWSCLLVWARAAENGELGLLGKSTEKLIVFVPQCEPPGQRLA
jgi:hypothetical protein